MDFSQLTDRQREVFLLIREANLAGRRITFRILMEAMEIKSPNGIAIHVKALKEKGFLKKVPKNTHAGLMATDVEMVPRTPLTDAAPSLLRLLKEFATDRYASSGPAGAEAKEIIGKLEVA